MKKKIVALSLCVAMLAIAIVGGTLAYFTDTDKVTNTMVIGNVDIDIDELTYMDEDGDGVKEWGKFVNDEFVLYPQKEEDGAVNFNKMVYTWNNSKNGQAAYIRTIILVEEPQAAFERDINPIQFKYSVNAKKAVNPAIRGIEIDGSQLLRQLVADDA